MKITVECDSLVDLKRQLESALVEKDVEMYLEHITERIGDQHREREITLKGLQQCTDAVRVMTERIPKDRTAQNDVCSLAERLCNEFSSWALWDEFSSRHAGDITVREVFALLDEIRILTRKLKEET